MKMCTCGLLLGVEVNLCTYSLVFSEELNLCAHCHADLCLGGTEVVYSYIQTCVQGNETVHMD